MIQGSRKNILIIAGAACLFLVGVYLLNYAGIFKMKYSPIVSNVEAEKEDAPAIIALPPLDTHAYDAKILALANYPAPVVIPVDPNTPSVTPPPPKKNPWPAETVYPDAGAILPFHRIVAYYGNFYSTKMGVLGEYPPDIMLEKLKAEVKNWETADPSTPVIPAIHYIAVTAQGSAGDGKYRLRMPDSQIDKAIELADKVHGVVFLDIQVGLSNVQTEIPLLEKYLKMPEVHLALDPEFSMKTGVRPGKVIGTMDATDINFAAKYLAKLVQDNNLTPKILVVHRFTSNMLTNYKLIKPLPEVQIVVDMDGWGFPAKKINTYNQVAFKEPVQFTGFKLFYKNDLKAPSTHVLTPAELLKLKPQPIYIQYQ